MIRIRNIPSLVFSIAVTLSCSAFAGEAAAPRVNGVAIPGYRIDHAVQAQVARGQKDSPELQKVVRQILINQELMAQAAIKAGVDKRPAVAAQLELDRTSILANAFLADYFSKNPIAEDAIRKEYERLKAQTPARERRVSHILVKTEQEAADVIAQLKGGAAFEKLAAERSQDAGTKERGGDLGFGPAERFPKPIADAIGSLAVGATTQAPVQSQFGYHVIRVDEERATTLATFEQARPQIQQLLQQQVAQKVVASLRSQAKVEE